MTARRLGLLLLVAILVGGCVVYDKHHTRVTPDAITFPDGPFIPWAAAHATLHEDTTTQVLLVWLYTCGAPGGVDASGQLICFLIHMQNYLSTPPADPLAETAFADCGMTTGVLCGQTIHAAIVGLLNTQPGAPGLGDRCLFFRAEEPLPALAWFDESQVRVIENSWGWVRHGNWGCSNV